MNGDHRATMPADEFKNIRHRLKLSMDQFAIELGYEGNRKGNINTIRRFESGRRNVPLPLAKLAWLLNMHGLPDSWPEYLEAKLAEVPEEDVIR